MSAPHLTEISRRNFVGHDQPTHEDIRTGCMQRMADATELAARNHASLVSNAEYWEKRARYLEQERDIEIHRCWAYRGYIGRLKRQIAALKAEEAKPCP